MLYESFALMEFENVLNDFKDDNRPKPWTFLYYDNLKKEWVFKYDEFEDAVKEYFDNTPVNSKYFTSLEEINIYREYFCYNFLFRSYTTYLIVYTYNDNEIDTRDKGILKRSFYARAKQLDDEDNATCEQYFSILQTKTEEEQLLAEQRKEYQRLRHLYQLEKENEALMSNYTNAMIGLTTIGVTLISGGTGTIFWLTLAGGGISFVGNTAQMFIRLSDDPKLKEKLKYIPADYNDIVFCSVTYLVGDSQNLQTANAVFDVVEGVIFLKLNPDIVASANVVVQGVEVYENVKSE